MILHPGILALIGGSGLVLLMLLYAGVLGLRILVRWDFASSSEYQLRLERRTMLVSTLLRWALGFEAAALLLFLYTVEEIHPLFTGAMCATGSLNANPSGWWALYARIGLFFGAAFWLVIDGLDRSAEDLPLVRPKYGTLIPLILLAAAAFVLQLHYFLGLSPEIITSCCGSLFTGSNAGIAGDLAALPPGTAMTAFYGAALLLLLSAAACAVGKWSGFRHLLAATAILFFPVSLAAIVSFISAYIYEMPTHHCPFDMFQGHYGFIGYPLYLSLFGGVFYGLLPGLCRPLQRIPSLRDNLRRAEARWIRRALVLILIFLGISTWPILTGPFSLRGY